MIEAKTASDQQEQSVEACRRLAERRRSGQLGVSPPEVPIVEALKRRVRSRLVVQSYRGAACDHAARGGAVGRTGFRFTGLLEGRLRRSRRGCVANRACRRSHLPFL